MKLESSFKRELIKELEDMGGIVLNNNPNDIQGFPDLTLLHEGGWVVLECKREVNSSHQPNQDYYVDLCNKMSYASFIYPENKEEVINEIKDILKINRSCFSKS